jgi:Spy/CpxP family protein refolding chaperone
MKKLMLLSAFATIITASAIAQDTKPASEPKEVKQDQPQQSRAEWEKKVKDELKLTADQTVKFDALNKEYNEKMDAVMKDASLTSEVQKEKKMALKKEKETKFFEFITPEQQAKYKELVEKKKNASKSDKS